MIDQLFGTEEKRQVAIAAFQNLMEHPGWKLLVQILDANIEVLRMQLETEADEEKLQDVRILRNNLRLTREFRNTPQDQIKKLADEGQEVPNADPYPEVKDEKEEEKTEET